MPTDSNRTVTISVWLLLGLILLLILAIATSIVGFVGDDGTDTQAEQTEEGTTVLTAPGWGEDDMVMSRHFATGRDCDVRVELLPNSSLRDGKSIVIAKYDLAARSGSGVSVQFSVEPPTDGTGMPGRSLFFDVEGRGKLVDVKLSEKGATTSDTLVLTLSGFDKGTVDSKVLSTLTKSDGTFITLPATDTEPARDWQDVTLRAIWKVGSDPSGAISSSSDLAEVKFYPVATGTGSFQIEFRDEAVVVRLDAP